MRAPQACTPRLTALTGGKNLLTRLLKNRLTACLSGWSSFGALRQRALITGRREVVGHENLRHAVRVLGAHESTGLR